MNITESGIAAPNMPPFSSQGRVCPALGHLLVIPMCAKSPLHALSFRNGAPSGRNLSRAGCPTAASRFHSSALRVLTPHAHHSPSRALRAACCLSQRRRPRRCPIPPHAREARWTSVAPLPQSPLPFVPSKTAAYWGLKRDIITSSQKDDRRSATSPLPTSPVTPLGTDSEPLVGWDRV